jgi:hypothetical protein
VGAVQQRSPGAAFGRYGPSGTQRQQSGGWSAGCWPVGQAAQRTFAQSAMLVSSGTQRQQSGGWSAGV